MIVHGVSIDGQPYAYDPHVPDPDSPQELLGVALLRSHELSNLTKSGKPRKRQIPLSEIHDNWLRATGRMK